MRLSLRKILTQQCLVCGVGDGMAHVKMMGLASSSLWMLFHILFHVFLVKFLAKHFIIPFLPYKKNFIQAWLKSDSSDNGHLIRFLSILKWECFKLLCFDLTQTFSFHTDSILTRLNWVGVRSDLTCNSWVEHIVLCALRNQERHSPPFQRLSVGLYWDWPLPPEAGEGLISAVDWTTLHTYIFAHYVQVHSNFSACGSM